MSLIALPLLVLVGCGGGPSSDPQAPEGEVPVADAPPPAEVVAGHTTGVISRKAAVRVRFAEPVGPEGGGPAEGGISLSPAVPGSTAWQSAQDLVFTPSADLASGATYTVTVDLPAVVGEGQPFSFPVSVVHQGFWVEQTGIEALGSGKQRFAGVLFTADDVGDEIERVLTATHEGSTLTVTWAHEGPRRHVFTVDGIQRQEQATELTLAFDGAAIGVASTRTLTAKVFGLADFDLTSARAIIDGERSVELRFTDPLDPDQDLRGLIGASGHPDLRTVRDGSVLRLFSSKGFEGDVTVRLDPALRSDRGYRLRRGDQAREITLGFAPVKPSVSFVGKGVIVPSAEGTVVPLDVVNVSAIEVEATRVFESNVPQFLQVNRLDGHDELHRVGRVVYRERLVVEGAEARRNQPIRMGLDLTKLVQDDPYGLYRLAVRFDRHDIVYGCPSEPPPRPPGSGDAGLPTYDWESGSVESSFWDNWDDESGMSGWELRRNRKDPCHPGYYREYWDHDITASRNVLVSDVGLIAKMGADDELVAVVTHLGTTEPLAHAEVQILDFQLQELATGWTADNGVVRLGPLSRKPFVVVAREGAQSAYVRLDRGSSLALAHFDVSGVRVDDGLKGFLYGERGVWRPGDDIFLTFVLRDEAGTLPADHPLHFELRDPRGQVVEQRVVPARAAVDGFFALPTRTAPSAPTGDYVATVRVGGAAFTEVLRVDTVMPNRLAIDLPLPDRIDGPDARLQGTLSSRWLHGALAPHLDASVDARMVPRPTSFDRFEEYVFDDPTAEVSSNRETVFEGTLDAQGRVEVDVPLTLPRGAGGMLTAQLTTRVFEPSGAFSIDKTTVPVSPHARYVGLRTPKGDKARGMLLTDTEHPVDVVLVDADGEPSGAGPVELKLYKVSWRWWWEKGDETFADYAGSTSHEAVASGVVDIEDGHGTWTFQIDYPQWGRYLLVATDKEGTHRAGKVLYIDWPGWAGRAQGDNPGGASVLTLTADRSEVSVGDAVKLTFPTGLGGRALVSLETGTEVLETHWVQPTGDSTSWSFTATPAMAPSVYATVTLLQPHGQSANDLPIRLYGITPIRVTDPESKLQPVITAPDELRPDTTHTVTVAEATGRPMTYTLAVVDEGLLGLTRFQTPDPWEHFFRREALGVRTWDVFDLVAGAFGGALDGLLAIGGDGEAEAGPQSEANRFEPVVRTFGPFHLERGKSRSHEVDVGQYVGEVRMMVVAGHEGAYGSAEKAVPVRTPLMVLATLPRVLGPQETVALPVSVFAMGDEVRDVKLSVSTEGPVSLASAPQQRVRFDRPGDQLATFDLRVDDALGVARVTVEATGGGESARQTLEIGVRHPGTRATEVVGGTVAAGETWSRALALVGLPGTNTVTLEVSRVPPVDLERRLEYLIRYPHGCVEQTTSSVFPQLHLSRLVELSSEREAAIAQNIAAGIDRLRGFQTASGGFAYWPGAAEANTWGSTYAGHFLIEAERAGHLLPSGVRERWVGYQRGVANTWVRRNPRDDLEQAYRLYTLALAGEPELGAMNRLREAPLDLAARWRLAAAYHLAGQPEAAASLVKGQGVSVRSYRELGGTFGSAVRDEAMILETLVLLGQTDQALPVARRLSERLSDSEPLNTQETAHALLAMSRFAGEGGGGSVAFSWSTGGGAETRVQSSRPVVQVELPAEEAVSLSLSNTSGGTLFPRVILSGLPAVGTERAASNGLAIEVDYTHQGGGALDVATLDHGVDFVATVEVANTSGSPVEQLALTHMVPSGWEIHGTASGVPRGAEAGFAYRDVRDDRVITYLSLAPGERRTFEVRLHSAYQGHYYLPPVSVQAMYDETIQARTQGRWIDVEPPGASL